jgi:phage major head subunit gpT-like protein
VQTRTADSDEPVFTRDQFQWGLRGRGVAGYTLPFLAIRGNS